jgi:hypothetical protein
MVPPGFRRLASLLFAAALVLGVAAPAFGYNEENVQHIRLSRLDPVQCSYPIRIVADLVDKRGDAVEGATVNFTLRHGQPGDVLDPTTDVSDSEGRARTTLDLSCVKGMRQVRASVPGDGRAVITIVCGKKQGCTIKTGALALVGSDDERGIGVSARSAPAYAGTAAGAPWTPPMPLGSLAMVNLLGLAALVSVGARLIRPPRLSGHLSGVPLPG